MYQTIHQPVLLSALKKFISSGELALDATFGGGGYTKYLLENYTQVKACDLDPVAVDRGKLFFQEQIKQGKLDIVNTNFKDYLKTFEDNSLDFIVADLGFSSDQLEYSNRGFSYFKLEEEFDLRYSASQNSNKAWQLITRSNTPEELAKKIYEFSGEVFSRKISNSFFKNIQRTWRDLKNKDQLNYVFYVKDIVEAVEEAIPKNFKNKKEAILSRVWQAFRIWVNDELESVKTFLLCGCDKLKPGGKIAIISFHSLEDKIVTNFFRRTAEPIEVDQYGNKIQKFRLLTKKAIVPSEEEISNNSRSRSAKLRVLEKLQS